MELIHPTMEAKLVSLHCNARHEILPDGLGFESPMPFGSDTRQRPPQSGFVQTGLGEIPNPGYQRHCWWLTHYLSVPSPGIDQSERALAPLYIDIVLLSDFFLPYPTLNPSYCQQNKTLKVLATSCAI